MHLVRYPRAELTRGQVLLYDLRGVLDDYIIIPVCIVGRWKPGHRTP